MSRITLFLALIVVAPAFAQERADAVTGLVQAIEKLDRGLATDPRTTKLSKPWRKVTHLLGSLTPGLSDSEFEARYRSEVLPAVFRAKRVMYANKVLCYLPKIRPLYHQVRLAVRRANRAILGVTVPKEEET